MPIDYEFAMATPEQLERSNDLAIKWGEEAGHPIVAVGAATTLLMNVLAQEAPDEVRQECIAAIVRSLNLTLD